MSTTDTRAAFEAWQRDCATDGWHRSNAADDWEVWQAATEAAKATGTAGEVQIDLPAIVKRLEDAVRHMDSYGYVGIGRPGVQSVINDISGALKRAARQPAPSRDEIEGAFAIKVEKMLCEALGRQWSAVGISVEGLISELKSQQPAPVVAVKTWQERMHADPAFREPLMPHEQPKYMEAEIADLRAALSTAIAPLVPMTKQEVINAMRENNLLTDIGYSALLNGDSIDATVEYITQVINYAAIPNIRANPAVTAAPAILSDSQILELAEEDFGSQDDRNVKNEALLSFARAILAATNRSQP